MTDDAITAAVTKLYHESGAGARQQSEQHPGLYMREAAGNVLPDAWEQGKNLVTGTLDIGKKLFGASQELGAKTGNFFGEMITGHEGMPVKTPNIDALKAMPGAMIDHYGGYLDGDERARRVRDNPVGVVADLIPTVGAAKVLKSGVSAGARSAAEAAASVVKRNPRMATNAAVEVGGRALGVPGVVRRVLGPTISNRLLPSHGPAPAAPKPTGRLVDPRVQSEIASELGTKLDAAQRPPVSVDASRIEQAMMDRLQTAADSPARATAREVPAGTGNAGPVGRSSIEGPSTEFQRAPEPPPPTLLDEGVVERFTPNEPSPMAGAADDLPVVQYPEDPFERFLPNAPSDAPAVPGVVSDRTPYGGRTPGANEGGQLGGRQVPVGEVVKELRRDAQAPKTATPSPHLKGHGERNDGGFTARTSAESRKMLDEAKAKPKQEPPKKVEPPKKQQPPKGNRPPAEPPKTEVPGSKSKRKSNVEGWSMTDLEVGAREMGITVADFEARLQKVIAERAQRHQAHYSKAKDAKAAREAGKK